MSWKGIERNRLDYILTDTLPVELSELFSFVNLYNFIIEKKQTKLKSIVLKIKKNKYSNDEVLFKKNWSTMPLKYKILKNTDSTREMSLIQPFSALNLYLFIECYQNEIINYFQKRHDFSIRYHTKYTNLYYKSKKNKFINYFQKIKSNVGRSIIQQNGNYFNILKYSSINSFYDSKEWRFNNFVFKLYAKLDYKSCFDSIYTHSFSRIIERNTIDAINAKNSHLFLAIDRILQNINGKISNGIVVGPEFSRMVSEILLQQIDYEVKIILFNKKLFQNKDYSIYRWVDDIYIFANERKDLDEIVAAYEHISEKYQLQFNESKYYVDNTPFIPKDWLEKTRLLVDRVIEALFQKFEGKIIENSLIKSEIIRIDRLKDEILTLMKNYYDNRRSIVSFLISSILKPISKKKFGYVLFNDNSKKNLMSLLDLILFIYAFSPAYEQTRKVIAIITYINSEIDLKNDLKVRKKINSLFETYSFIFEKSNLFDLWDWFPFFYEYKLNLNSKTEEIVLSKCIELNNPILWGNILVYSKYNKDFFEKIKNILEKIIYKQIEMINTKNIMMYREFWYVIIYYNCNLISEGLKIKILDKITELKNISNKNSNDSVLKFTIEIICDFMLKKSELPTEKTGFFNWDGINQFGARITYRTYQRTLFKNYKNSLGLIDTSLN